MERGEVVDWIDLLAVPFLLGSDDPARGGIDCWGVARILHQRAGWPFPDITRTTPEATRIGYESFTRVSDLRPLTMLFSDQLKLGYPSHVSTIVRPGYALSTGPRHGAYCWPLHRVPQELGAWRVTPP